MNREFDIAIAEELGKVVHYKDKSYVSIFGANYSSLPHYSTDGNAMLELDKEMRERGYWLTSSRYFVVNGVAWWEATYWKQEKDGIFSSGYSSCEIYARALAAYKALTGKDFELKEGIG